MNDIIKYHNTNPRSRIVVSAEMKNRRYRVAYVTTFTKDEHGTWGAIIPFGFKRFEIQPQKDYQAAIDLILTFPCCAEYTLDGPAQGNRMDLVFGDDYGSRPGEGGIGDYQGGDEPTRPEE